MDNPLDILLQRPELEAIVVSVEDPEQQMRVQVRVFGLFDGVEDSDLPWATYKLPIGARVGEGDFTPVQVADLVWIDFPYYTHGKKDTRRPRITGSIHHMPGGVPNLPPGTYGQCEFNHRRSHNEPDVERSPEYHQDRVYILHGMMFEVQSNSVYRITHMNTGTSFEFDARGNSILHVEGDSHHSATKDIEVHAGKNLNQSVGENLTQNIGGFWRINVDGPASVNAETISFNDGQAAQKALRACDLCVMVGTPHGQGSNTVKIGN